MATGAPLAAGPQGAVEKEEAWALGRKYLAEGRVSEAKAAFQRLLAGYPDEPDLHFLLALAALRLRDASEAERALRRALAADRDHVQARTLLGWIELEVRGNADGAIREYSRVIELRPDAPDAYVNLGAAYKKKGELGRALANYNEALKRRPDDAAALANRGWVFIEQERWAEARADFDRALGLRPKDPGALQGLAQVLEKTRDYAGAQAVLQSLISQSPNFVFWLQWGRLGLIRFYWVLLLIAIGWYLAGRVRKARDVSHG
ncbi:MAG TPA: tetratricopeptide repeat protein [candidate division Zixibacteria bacterium]|nr:tetratricopeptide repeat protein [candidate division Zixibacteria bacterium]